MIKPSVGRVVHYNNDPKFPQSRVAPLAAMIACVLSDTRVNLTVLDTNGGTHAVQDVELVQEETATRPTDTPFAEWMPYQRGQAAAGAGLGRPLPEGVMLPLPTHPVGPDDGAYAPRVTPFTGTADAPDAFIPNGAANGSLDEDVAVEQLETDGAPPVQENSAGAHEPPEPVE